MNTIAHLIHYILWVMLALPISLAYADEASKMQGLIEHFIAEKIELHEGERLSVQANTLDSTNGQPNCSEAIHIEFSQETLPIQANALTLTCPGQPGWSMLVPVSIQVYTKVLVAARNLPPGEAIQEEDITWGEQNKNHLHDGFFKDPNEVIGLAASRTIHAGARLTKRNIKPISIVKRNQTVTLTLQKGALQVEMVGIAKSDGALNQVIRVMNPATKKMVEAVVVGQDRVKIVA